MSFEYQKSVIGKLRKGSAGDEFVTINETLQCVNSKVVLSEVADEFTGLIVKTFDESTTLTEIKSGTPTENQFLCDYNLGIVHLHSSRNNERFIFDFKGRGSLFLAAERIYTKQANGSEIIETLRDVLDEADSVLNLSDRLTNLGDYSSTTVYYDRNIVTYDNASYMCINNDADGILNIPPTDTDNWKQIVSVKEAVENADLATTNANNAATNADTQATYAQTQGDYAKLKGDNLDHKGDYDVLVAYSEGNIVDYFGNSYMCILDANAGIDPTNTTYWRSVITHATPNEQSWSATEGQTVFTITNGSYSVGNKYIEVWVGGSPQISGEGFTETNSTTITLSEGISEGTRVYAKWFEGATSIAKSHKNTHLLGGNDEIDVTQLKNFAEQVSTPLAQKATKDELTLTEERIDKNVTLMRDGLLKLPSDFPTFPFSISKTGKRKYRHNATPYNQFDWSSATEVFISPVVSGSSLGTSVSEPISLGRFKANIDSNLYSGEDTFILTFITNIYHHSGASSLSSLGLNILFRSLSPSGFTWIIPSLSNVGAENQPYTWSAYNSIYTTTKANTNNVDDIVNFKNVDNYGIPKNQYTKVNDLATCESTKGTFFQDGSTTLYCNPFDDDDINFNYLNSMNQTLALTGSCGTTVFENIGFTTNSHQFAPTGMANFYFFGCKFYRGLHDSFAIDGDYRCYVFDCIGAFASKDCFNFHRDNEYSIAVEVNCVGYGAGKFKIPGGNTTTNSNNGSTAHSGMYMLRVGGKYWDCEGAIADADCYSICVGCEHYDILPTCTGDMYGFNLYKVNYPEKPKYAVDCLVSGDNFTLSLGGWGTIYSVSMESKYNIQSNVIVSSSWEGALNA